MVLEHKPCAVEYVSDKAKVFKDSQEFKRLVEGISENLEDVNLLESSIKLNKTQIKDIDDKFIEDVETFKDEIIANVKKQSDEIIKEAENIKAENTKQMDVLEEKCGRVSKDLASLTQKVDLLSDKPNKLFVSSLQLKETMKDIHDQLEEMKKRNVIENYHFIRDGQIGCTKLGSLHKDDKLGKEEACKNEQIIQEADVMERMCSNMSETTLSSMSELHTNPKCCVCHLELNQWSSGYQQYQYQEEWLSCSNCLSTVHVHCVANIAYGRVCPMCVHFL